MTGRADASLRSAARAASKGVEALDRFTRIHFVGFTSLWALLGALSANPDPEPTLLAGLLGLGVAFHFYGGVLNDVVDLELDRRQPLRQGDPLVEGRIGRGQALLFALAQLPLAFALSASLGAGLYALGLLATACAAMAVYDLFGKRCPVPPMTDGAQGVAWAALVLVGAELAGGPRGPLTWVTAAYGFGFTLLINGVHGGLRDLENDLAQGARTTAIFLGVRPSPHGRAQIPRRAWVYCFALQLALLGLALAAAFAASPASRSGPLLVLASGAGCLWLMSRVLRPELPGWHLLFRLHLAALLLPLLGAVLSPASARPAAFVLVVLFAPLLLLDSVHAMFAWVSRRLRRGAR